MTAHESLAKRLDSVIATAWSVFAGLLFLAAALLTVSLLKSRALTDVFMGYGEWAATSRVAAVLAALCWVGSIAAAVLGMRGGGILRPVLNAALIFLLLLGSPFVLFVVAVAW